MTQTRKLSGLATLLFMKSPSEKPMARLHTFWIGPPISRFAKDRDTKFSEAPTRRMEIPATSALRCIVIPATTCLSTVGMLNQRTVGIEIIIFPSGLVFLENEITDALLPVMPGLLLKSSFFTETRSFSARYPGWPGVFSDFLSIRTSSGQFSMYGSTTELTNILIVELGFVHDDDYLNASAYVKHDFNTYVPPKSN